jgi:hypothetical protein
VRSDAFHRAVEARDPEALGECLAEDVAFRSPVTFRPYEGKALVLTILVEGAMKVFSDFRYTDRLETGDVAVLVFKARVGEREIDGIDLLRFDEEGRVRELMVMVRPMSGVQALAAEMGRRFEQLGLTPAGH